MDEGLLVLRLWLGGIFVIHGLPKVIAGAAPPPWAATLFGADYAEGLKAGRRGGGEAFRRLGLPQPELAATTAGASQLVGGLIVAIGWGARVGAAVLAVNMLVAILVKRSNGLVGAAGFEYPLSLLVCTVPILMSGPGSYAV